MPSAGDIEGGDVIAVGPGLIRLDLTTYDASAHKEGHRVAAVLDLPTARALVIALCDSISKAEVEEARQAPRKKK